MSSQPVGSLPEEAAKLFAVLQGWATDHSQVAGTPGADDGSASTSDGDEPRHGTEGPCADQDPPPECRYCVWCQLIRAARATSPEVREHLTSAATSFALALQALLETPAERRKDAERESPIEKIDLSED